MPRVRKEPYDPELFESEAWRRFWWGKTTRVKKATQEYLEKYQTPRETTQQDSAMKHNCTVMAIMLNIKQLKASGIIPNLNHTAKRRTALPRKFNPLLYVDEDIEGDIPLPYSVRMYCGKCGIHLAPERFSIMRCWRGHDLEKVGIYEFAQSGKETFQGWRRRPE